MENVSTYLEVTDEDFLEDGNMLYPFFFLCLAIYEAKLMIKGWCALSISLVQVPVWLKHYYSELIGLGFDRVSLRPWAQISLSLFYSSLFHRMRVIKWKM